MIGLGRMGANMVRRIVRDGHTAVVYNRTPEIIATLESEFDGAVLGATSPADFVEKLDAPRSAWVMVPSGEPTESVVAELGTLLEAGDLVIDGGNSYFKDDVRRARTLSARGIDYMDVGVSGGVWGLERGYCLMYGGLAEQAARLEPILRSLAPGVGDVERTHGRAGDPSGPELGYLHCGPIGSGHYVKMIHNGIEYGMMQAYGEGFDIMRHAGDDAVAAEYRFDLDLPAISELWRRGSVVTSWLLDLTAQALLVDPELEGYSGVVGDSGEGRWTVQAAVEQAVPAEVLTAALYSRFRSRQEHTFAEKILSAQRKGFGGHVEPSAPRG